MKTATPQPLPQRIAGSMLPVTLATAPAEVITAVLAALRTWTPRPARPRG